MAAEDVLVADFESDTYGNWQVVGEAFGPGPAEGTLPNQMVVSGYRGARLVNSYYQGDGTVGTLTSPVFTIERKCLNFLIGGGGYASTTCMNLLVDNAIRRTATGPNRQPGGSERLRWQHWDVADLVGKTARIQIVDQRTEGWGHINVDHIVQSDEPLVSERTMELHVEKRYLNLPVKNGAPKVWMRLRRGDEILREFEIELAQDEPDFWVTLDLRPFSDETLTLWADEAPKDTSGFDSIVQADALIGAEDLYRERFRPQFHFSSQRGWNNDPNGMVYYEGEYHLFYQHNPYGWNWGNMTWGHAVSRDLVHWTELGDAIHPDRLGTIFSGSAVVDEKNSTGFKSGDESPIVCVFTSAGGTNPWSQGAPFTQSIAYSNDRGRTWTVYDGNPVQAHVNGANRDPKAFWHEAAGQWVIVLYLDDHRMAFYTSKDLKSWEFQSELKCFHECPELFQLPVDGDETKAKWVLYGASGEYFVGEFDGKAYTPDTEAIRYNYGNCFYASQTFNNVPAEDGRRIQIAWGRVGRPDMPFNQQMDFPVELTLRSTDDGVRLFAKPVREIALLHENERAWKDVDVAPDANPLGDVHGVLLDIHAEFTPGDAAEVGLDIAGVAITYRTGDHTLACKDESAPLELVDGKVRLRVLVDRMSIEIFANDGRVYMPMGHVFEEDSKSIAVFAKGAPARLDALTIHELGSAW